ncbi:uncharacterized protein [Miscanthus floridulus]|uniref:uncharacterized protein n=1 Tax=Miscanthus floridulus TaxID=154761 RepID=UPI00345A3D30
MDECILQFCVALTRATMLECHRDRCLTITADDLIAGFARLGLADYVQPMSEFLRLYRENVNQQVVAPPAPSTPTVEEEMAAPPPPPSPDLMLQLGLPSIRDVTELAPHTDEYALWPGGAQAAVGTSLALVPPRAAADEGDE